MHGFISHIPVSGQFPDSLAHRRGTADFYFSRNRIGDCSNCTGRIADKRLKRLHKYRNELPRSFEQKIDEFRLSEARSLNGWNPAGMVENAKHMTIRHYVVAAASVVVAILIVIAIAFATQEHNDRVLTEGLDRTGVELQVLGRQ